MTISTVAQRKQYSGDGSTVTFAFPYQFLKDDDLVLVLTDATDEDDILTLTTDYSVSGASDPAGGTVTVVTAPAVGETLTIYRSTDLTQETNLTPGGKLPAEDLEDALDKLTLVVQDLKREISQCYQLPTTSTSTPTILTNFSRCLRGKTGNFTFPMDATDNVIPFQSHVDGDSTIWDNDNHRFVIPAAWDGLVVRFTANIRIYAATQYIDNEVDSLLTMRKNGIYPVDGLPSGTYFRTGIGLSTLNLNMSSFPMVVAEGDYFDLVISIDFPGSIDNAIVKDVSWFGAEVVNYFKS